MKGSGTPMQPSDIELINSVSQPTVHPDGSYAVCAVSRPDVAADAYVGQLWRVPVPADGAPPTDGAPAAAPRRLTRGFRDSAPQISPTGELIAFLRSVPGAPAQLYVVDASGGEPVQVTDRKLGVAEFAWSPDGTRLAFISREPEPGRYGTVDGLGASAEPPRRIDRQNYRQNGLGYDQDRPAQVFLVDVPDVYGEPLAQPAPTAAGPADPLPIVAEPVRISQDDVDHHGLSFAPDGRRVATLASIHPGRDDDRRNDLLLLAIDGSGRLVPTAAGRPLMINSAAYDPSGAIWLEAGELGPDGRDFVGRTAGLYRLATDQLSADAPSPTMIIDPAATDVGENCSTIVPRDDGSVLVVCGERGRHRLVTVAADGTTTVLTAGEIGVSGIAATTTTAGPIVFSYSDPSTFGDLGLVQSAAATDADHVRLTDFSAAVRDHGLVTARELTITGRDGYPVHGWLAVPEGDGPFPTLLMIHGGPFAGYGVSAFDEVQILVGEGYAVAYSNPRGSRGYGEEHGRAIRQRMGTVDLTDVLDFFDGALNSDDRLDATRTGILGGSYGGYLTAWTIAHDHRWAGAIVERGFLDPELFFGTSDIGSFFGIEYVGTDPDLMRQQSPQAVAAQVTTPTLVLHSEEDLRCPLSQAERYFATLKRQGVDTELVVFPGENHELSRSGRPRHRVQRFEIVLDWWQRCFDERDEVENRSR